MKLSIVKPRRAPKYCSFCGRPDDEIDVMLRGAGETFICDMCVSECVSEIARIRAGRQALTEGR